MIHRRDTIIYTFRAHAGKERGANWANSLRGPRSKTIHHKQDVLLIISACYCFFVLISSCLIHHKQDIRHAFVAPRYALAPPYSPLTPGSSFSPGAEPPPLLWIKQDITNIIKSKTLKG